MEFVYLLGGGAPVVKTYLVTAAVATAGILLEGSDTATGSVIGSVQPAPASGAGATQLVGLSVDAAASYPANPVAQLNADADVTVSVIVSPNAVYRCKMSGGATADTALTAATPSAADSVGDDTSITALAGGIIWGYTGNNVGSYRLCNNTDGSVGISWPNAVATTDTYLVANVAPCRVLATNNNFFDLTTDLTQADASATSADNNNFIVVDVELNDSSEDGTTNSYYHVVGLSHAFAGGNGVVIT